MGSDLDARSELSPVKRALLKLEEMQATLRSVEQARQEPVAVIGLACRFPGGANDPEAFWRLLREGREAVTEIPSSRWDVQAYYDPDPGKPGKMSTRFGAFLDQIDRFDPQFFGISPREASGMDPQQRLLLEVTWEALEDAGKAPEELSGSRTGVFIGMCTSDYSDLQLRLNDPARLDAYYASGIAHSMASGRLSYVLGLQGPSITLDTACSSSLVAVHLACQSLRSRECHLALAGGVNVMLSPEIFIALTKTAMLAPDGRCKTFDASADGFGRGEGCGIVVLKRLSDAFADGDRVLALVRGSACNQDGPSSGLTAPNGPSQMAVIRDALANGGVAPAEVGYVETHGTGTSLGDPIEVQALGAVFGEDRPCDQPLLIGGVKTNIGHLEAAAGIAGLIKVVLALQHAEIPPSLHVRRLNAFIPWDELSVKVATQLTPWRAEGRPRLAGVSSFGFSGTNAHVVLQAAPARKPVDAEVERPRQLLALSAASDVALSEVIGRYHAHLSAHPEEALTDVCHTANSGRVHLGHRIAIVAESSGQMCELLGGLASGEIPTGVLQGKKEGSGPPKVAFLCTGQGAQFVGMGRRLYETQPTFRRALEQCDELLRPHLSPPLLSALYPKGGDPSPLDQTAYAQPALFAVEYALAELWRSWGVEPAAVLGHSVGEYVAACVAGVFSLEDALRLIAARGRLMQALPGGGAMAAVLADEGRVGAALNAYDGRVSLAAINAPSSVVISGEGEAVAELCARFAAEGVKSKPLTVSHAFHSPLMQPILAEFEGVAAGVRFASPRLPLVSNVSGEGWRAGERPDARYWARHVREPVHFRAGLEWLHRSGIRVFLEVGPTPTLSGLGPQCIADPPCVWLASLRKGRDDWESMLASLGALYVRGADVDWRGFDQDYSRCKVSLPTYPFQRERYWFSRTAGRAVARTQACPEGVHPLLGRRVRSAVLADEVFEREMSALEPDFAQDHRIHGSVVLPPTAYVEMALAAGAVRSGSDDPVALEDLAIHEALVLPATGSRTVQVAVSREAGGTTSVRVFSLSDTDAGMTGGGWRHHASAQVVAGTGSAPGSPSLSLDEARRRCPDRLSAASFYEALHARGFELGERFLSLAELWLGDAEAVGRIECPASLVGSVGGYSFHPAILDGCLQVLAGATLGNGTGEAEIGLLMPIGIEAVHVLTPPGTRLWSHAMLRGGRASGSETGKGDVRVYDEDGRPVALLSGVAVKRLDPETLRQSFLVRAAEGRDWLYEVQWQKKPLAPAHPETGSVESAGSGAWLILSDRGGFGREVTERIRQGGGRVVEVAAASQVAPAPGDHSVDPAPPESMHEVVTQAHALARGGDLRVVHFRCLDSRLSQDMSADAVQASQVASGTEFLNLVHALAAATSDRIRLWVVTRGVQKVDLDGAPVNPAQAPLWALGRQVGLEYPALWGGLLDLAPAGGEDEAGALVAEMTRPDGEDQVAIRAGVRYVARLARRPMPDAQCLRVRSDSRYLVTGGLGGLGLEVARWLAQQGARHLVVTGRSGLPDRSLWPELPPGAEAARRVAGIQAVESLGATVEVESVDVADEESMGALFQRFREGGPPLRGIFHLAADIRGAALESMNREALAAMMRPKVVGAWLLHRLSRGLELDCFVLFSSMASLLGAKNMGHYAAANQFMDALSHQRQAYGLPSLAVNWGVWEIFPRASTEEHRSMANVGHLPISTEAALKILARLIGTGVPQAAVAAVDWSTLRAVLESRRRLPLLENLSTSPASTVGPAKRSDLLRRLTQIAAGQRRDFLLAYLRGEVAHILQLDASHAIEPWMGLFEMGMDSLMSVELRRRLEAALGRSMPSTLTFNYPNIGALADYLMHDVLAPMFPVAEGAQAPAVMLPSAEAPLAHLTEDELAALLAAKVKHLEC